MTPQLTAGARRPEVQETQRGFTRIHRRIDRVALAIQMRHEISACRCLRITRAGEAPHHLGCLERQSSRAGFRNLGSDAARARAWPSPEFRG